jgi:hypothetical protein
MTLHDTPEKQNGGPNSPWLRDLLGDLKLGINRELQTTLSVAVCVSAKMPRSEMVTRLGITDTEAKMAMLRLASIMGKPA